MAGLIKWKVMFSVLATKLCLTQLNSFQNLCENGIIDMEVLNTGRGKNRAKLYETSTEICIFVG